MKYYFLKGIVLVVSVIFMIYVAPEIVDLFVPQTVPQSGMLKILTYSMLLVVVNYRLTMAVISYINEKEALDNSEIGVRK